MMVPILLPIATQFGIDPVHFGVLCCFNLTIGLISPPVGMTLFVTANVAKVKLTALFKEVIPFVVLGYATVPDYLCPPDRNLYPQSLKINKLYSRSILI